MIDHQSVPNANRGCFPTGPARNCRCGSSHETTEYSDKTSSQYSSDYRTSDIVDYYKRRSDSTTSEKYSDKTSEKYSDKTSEKYSDKTSCETECEEEYTIEEIASISRELSYNDSFIVDLFDEAENRTGTPADRNVELLLFNPLKRCKEY